MTELPSCFGVAWDAPGVPECAGCGVQAKCKDQFINVTFKELYEAGGDPSALPDALGVSEAAITEAESALSEIIGPPPIEGETETEESTPPKREPMQTEIKGTEKKSEVENEDRPIPYKKRRGRKPANLVMCDKCAGTGWVDGAVCTVCAGYGDHSFPVEKDAKAGQKAKSKRKGKQPIDKTVATRNDADKEMGGTDTPSTSDEKPLPVSGEKIPNTVLSGSTDSGGTYTTKAKAGPKKAKGDKEVSGLVGSAFLQATKIIELAKDVASIYIDYENGEARVVYKI